ncbi:TetR/AcrR family transcriptional regulator [Nonomuraea wenchangensis]|uniref:TetR/AcrR family transcriptional regulator n=1 Tax=Nonomuraea wenchangensis TaxID=568860 RepID=UPI00384EF8CC
MRGRPSLPVLGQPQPERADAARNRQKIIDATARIIVERGAAAGLSLDEVARMAGVGVGTVYRRFGDRNGLVLALMDEQERRFQTEFFSGPPPLGPGAPPGERIAAFLGALVDRVLAQQELFLLLEKGGKPWYGGPYRVHHIHLATLVGQARPDVDAAYLADALLAPVNAVLIAHQREARGMSVAQIKAGLAALAAAAVRA